MYRVARHPLRHAPRGIIEQLGGDDLEIVAGGVGECATTAAVALHADPGDAAGEHAVDADVAVRVGGHAGAVQLLGRRCSGAGPPPAARGWRVAAVQLHRYARRRAGRRRCTRHRCARRCSRSARSRESPATRPRPRGRSSATAARSPFPARRRGGTSARIPARGSWTRCRGTWPWQHVQLQHRGAGEAAMPSTPGSAARLPRWSTWRGARIVISPTCSVSGAAKRG